MNKSLNKLIKIAKFMQSVDTSIKSGRSIYRNPKMDYFGQNAIIHFYIHVHVFRKKKQLNVKTSSLYISSNNLWLSKKYAPLEIKNGNK